MIPMDYFLTGSTGFIGNELMNKLLSEGNRVHVLVRSAAKLRDPAHPGLKVFIGDGKFARSPTNLFDDQAFHHTASSYEINAGASQ